MSHEIAEAVLRKAGVTPAESAVLALLSHLNNPRDCLAGMAAGDYYSLAGPVSLEQCVEALDSCFERGFLQIVDERFLNDVRDELAAASVAGPFFGFATPGFVDFTRDGAGIWLHLCAELLKTVDDSERESEDESVCSRPIHRITRWRFPSRERALAQFEHLRGDPDTKRIDGPFEIGPWRAQWWRRFDSGFCVELEETNGFTGFFGGCHPWSVWGPRFSDSDWERLPGVLERRGVGALEWLMLMQMESLQSRDWRDAFDGARRRAENHLSQSPSTADLAVAFCKCLDLGRLKVVDAQAVEEIRAELKRAEAPSQLEYPDENIGLIDFTREGACLYRDISRDWLGERWEESVSTDLELCREEHCYSRSETALQQTLERRLGMGQPIRSHAMFPIGPWCTYWWDRHESGFRLELKFGEPPA